jgi:hypothetical protein
MTMNRGGIFTRPLDGITGDAYLVIDHGASDLAPEASELARRYNERSAGSPGTQVVAIQGLREPLRGFAEALRDGDRQGQARGEGG